MEFIFWFRNPIDPQVVFHIAHRLLPDARLGYVMKPNLQETEVWDGVETMYDTDALGFRNQGLSYDASLFFVGDSFAYAGELPREQAFFSLIGKQQQLTPITYGVGGYSLPQYKVIIRDIIPQGKNKTVVIAIFANSLEKPLPDAMLATHYEKNLLPRITQLPWRKRLRLQYTFSFYLWQQIKALFGKKSTIILPSGIQLKANSGASKEFKDRDSVDFFRIFEELLEEIKKRTDIEQALIVLIPTKESVYGEEHRRIFGNFLDNEAYGYTGMAERAHRAGVSLLDLTDILKKRRDEHLYCEKNLHWTERGHQLAAEEIGRHLFTLRT